MESSGETINVSSKSADWRGLALSNFGLSPFVLDGALFASVEGFIQGIKFPEGDPRRAAAFVSSGWPAKRLGDTADRSGAYWGGMRLAYGSPDHHRLIERAMRARIAQSAGLQEALKSTADATLIHDTGAAADFADDLPADRGVLPDSDGYPLGIAVGQISGESGAIMRIGVSMFLSAMSEADTDRALAHVLALGRKAEAAGLSGIWATNSLGRGHPTLDPLLALAPLCGVTERIEIGTCVLQVTLRPAAELAHRVQSLNVLSRGRLRLGVGVGSTRADFEVAGADFAGRFERLESTVDTMRAAWRGRPTGSGTAALAPWPRAENGPPVFLGAWRKAEWIRYAARHCDGWIASGMKSSWRDVEEGMRVFRAAQGKRAILANLGIDLGASPVAEADGASISLICSPAAARERLKRLEQLGFDDVLLACPFGSATHIDEIADLARSL